MSKKGSFEKNNQVWPVFCFLLSSSSLIPIFYYYNNTLCHAPLPFYDRAPLLHRPLQKPLDNVSGKCRPWNMSFGDLKLHGHSDIFFFGVNRSGLRTSSIANHTFYKALGWLHGPWCNNPYTNSSIVDEGALVKTRPL